MMKKLIALILALCTLLLCACAFAEDDDEEEKEFKWADFEAAAADYPGAMMDIGDTGLIMYVPETFTVAEINQKMADQGVILKLTAPKKWEITVTHASLGEMDEEDYVAELEENGAKNAEYMMVNDLDAVNYDKKISGSKASCVFIVNNDDNTITTFAFSPMKDKKFVKLATIMMASIQAKTKQ